MRIVIFVCLLQDAYLNPSSGVLRLTRAGDIVKGLLPSEPNDLWTIFSPNHTTYEAVSMATHYHDHEAEYLHSPPSTSNMPLITVIQVHPHKSKLPVVNS